MRCRVCGAELHEGTLFCGNCGSSVTASRVRPPEIADSRPSDTSIVAPLAKPGPGRSKPAVAGRFPGEVPDLAVHRPTLEDVYLRMTGDRP